MFACTHTLTSNHDPIIYPPQRRESPPTTATPAPTWPPTLLPWCLRSAGPLHLHQTLAPPPPPRPRPPPQLLVLRAPLLLRQEGHRAEGPPSFWARSSVPTSRSLSPALPQWPPPRARTWICWRTLFVPFTRVCSLSAFSCHFFLSFALCRTLLVSTTNVCFAFFH